jgi:acetyl esterase/lipase
MEQTNGREQTMSGMRPWLSLIAVTALTLAMTPSVQAGPTHHRRTGPGGISFRPPVDFATGAVPSSAAFNAASGDQVAMLLARTSTLSDAVAVGDFNHDRKHDVAQTNVIAGSVTIFLGDGRGGFAPPVSYPVGQQPQFVVAHRLNGDRHLDLAVANTGSSDIAVLLGAGDGTFLPAASPPVPVPKNVAIGDFNDDDLPDLAVASGGRTTPAPTHPTGGVAILTGNASGTFVPTQFIHVKHTATNSRLGANFVAVGDFDRSGSDDIAVAVGGSKSAGDRKPGGAGLTGDDVLIFLNRNQSAAGLAEPFGTTPDQPAIRVGASPDAIAVARLNGDRFPDLAVMANASGDMTTLLGNRHGRFVAAANNITASRIPRALAVGDFNGDGIRDLVTGNFHGSTISVLQGNGDGSFQPAVDFWSGDATTGVAVGHFDGDRRLDVVAARLQDDELALLRNNASRRGDGIVVTRDIPYGSPTHRTNDPLAAHHVLDVYEPPPGTPSLTGKGRPYPVAVFVHGGAGVSGDKAMAAPVMRSLAMAGIVVVATDYRLPAAPPTADDEKAQTGDLQHAFRWVREHVGSRAYGGDPQRIFVFGHSHGALLAAKFGAQPDTWEEQQHIRGLVLVSFCHLNVIRPAPTQRPSLLLTGDTAWEAACARHSEAFAQASTVLGAQSAHVISPDTDHMTVLAHMALSGDPAREAMVDFMREQSRGRSAAGAGEPTGGERSEQGDRMDTVAAGNGAGSALPATGGPPAVTLAGATLCLLSAALRRRVTAAPAA